MIKKIFAISVLLSGMILGRGFAEARYVSPKELAGKADLIVVGTVSKVEQSQEIQPGPGKTVALVKYAQVSVEEVIKGAPAKEISVIFAYNEDVEADVQDPNLKEGQKALFYLTSIKGKENVYRVANGWSGRCRISGDKIYHQYDTLGLGEYIKALKDNK